MKKLIGLFFLIPGLVLAQGSLEAKKQCEQNKKRSWRMAIVDCSRVGVSLFDDRGSPTRESVISGLVANLTRPFPSPDGSLVPSGPKPKGVILGQPTSALELELLDKVYCAGKFQDVAFKHEADFAALFDRKDYPAWLGQAAVYRRADGSLVCVEVTGGASQQIYDVN
ncbi:MAG: hypothetical protein V1798_00160 [Pseudomonadota bacterium]